MDYFIKNIFFVYLQFIAKFIIFSLFVVKILFAEETTTIKSNKINKKEDNIITAIGDVEIKRGDHVLNAEEVEYNQKTKQIKTNSSVRIYNTKDKSIFFSETALINDDLVNADFYNGLMIFNDGSSILSPHMSRSDEKIINMQDTEYRVCPTDLYDEDLTYEKAIEELNNQRIPLFSLKSYKATADTDEKTLKLVGTSFWFWKIPFFFVPYLKTSYDYNIALNGFGSPKLEKSSRYGYGISIPYKIITDNQNFRITPKVYTKDNFLTNIKYGINSNNNRWSLNFDGDIANDNGQSKDLTNAYGVTEEAEGNYKKWRGYFASNGFFDINNLWKIDYNGKIVSDRYYLRDYYSDSSEYIQSYINLTRVNTNDLYDFNTFQFINLFYQDLLEYNGINNPRYAPVTNLNIQDYIIKKDNSNLIYKVQTNTTNLFRVHGLQYNRFTLMPSLNYMQNGVFGTINSSFQLIGDSYFINNNDIIRDKREYRKNENILTPQFNLEWRKSFIFNNILIQPIIKYSVSPHSTDFSNEIPNEDVQTHLLSFENIFSNNRYYGYDRREVGNRITYGFESIIFNNLTFGMAQGYKDNLLDDEYLIGFDDNVSDYVGYVSYMLNNNLDIYYKFLLDRENLDLKGEELTANFNYKILNLYLTYVNIRPTLNGINKQKQVKSHLSLSLYDNWKIKLSGVLDLEHDNRLLESEIGLIYDGGCTMWELVYSNSNPLTETEKSNSINFNFVIKFL